MNSNLISLRAPDEVVDRVFRELEDTKKHSLLDPPPPPSTLFQGIDIGAAIAPELSNHEIFERWRSKDVALLSDEEAQAYQKEAGESHRRYDRAWSKTLARVQTDSLRIFWKPFGFRYQDGAVVHEGYGAIAKVKVTVAAAHKWLRFAHIREKRPKR